jgi:hypothetical protein
VLCCRNASKGSADDDYTLTSSPALESVSISSLRALDQRR